MKTAFALIALILLIQAAGGTFPSAGETPAPAADEGPVPAILYMLRRDIQSGNEKRIRAALEYAAGCGPEEVRALVPEALGNPAAGRWAREAVLRRPEDFDEFAERISAFARRKGDAELMFAYPWEGRAADFKEAHSRASGRSRARLLALAARPAPPEWVVGLAEFEAENPAAGVLTADAARLVMFMAGKGEAPVSLLAVPPALPPVFYERLARACAARFDERVREGLRGALERRGEGNVEWGRKALAAPGVAGPLPRIRQVYGSAFAEKLIEVRLSEPGYELLAYFAVLDPVEMVDVFEEERQVEERTAALQQEIDNHLTNITNQVNHMWQSVNNTNTSIINQLNAVWQEVNNTNTTLVNQVNMIMQQIINYLDLWSSRATLPGTVRYWTFDNKSFKDNKGNDPITTNNVSFSNEGKYGGAAQFSGDESYICAANGFNLSNGTVELWIKTNFGNEKDRGIVNKSEVFSIEYIFPS